MFFTLCYTAKRTVKNKIIQYMELIIIAQTTVILFLSYKLYWYRKYYKSQMNLNNLKDIKKELLNYRRNTIRHNFVFIVYNGWVYEWCGFAYTFNQRTKLIKPHYLYALL